MFHMLSGFKWDGHRWTATLHDDVTNLFRTRHYAYMTSRPAGSSPPVYVKAALTRLVAVGAIVKFEFAKCPHAKKPGVLVTKKNRAAAEKDGCLGFAPIAFPCPGAGRAHSMSNSSSRWCLVSILAKPKAPHIKPSATRHVTR